MATFGVMMFPTDYAIQPVELAQAVEARGGCLHRIAS